MMNLANYIIVVSGFMLFFLKAKKASLGIRAGKLQRYQFVVVAVKVAHVHNGLKVVAAVVGASVGGFPNSSG